jgi:hypothetical protein
METVSVEAQGDWPSRPHSDDKEAAVRAEDAVVEVECKRQRLLPQADNVYVGRIAPTPSGHLHGTGNLLCFKCSL